MKKSILAHKARIVILITLISACLTSAGWAASYYVDSISGNDTSSGTLTAPWKTVAKVNSFALKAGDFVYFKDGGTWNEALYPQSGVSGGAITYGAYGTGSKPVIKNFYADNKSFIRLQDLEFRSKAADVPVLIYNGSNHISVNNCNIIADTSCTAYVALWLTTNVSYNEIVNCNLQHNNAGIQCDVINLRLNANYNIIKGNTISGSTHYCIASEGSTSTYPTYTCNYNVIQNNTIQTTGAGLTLISNSNRNLVEGNVIMGGKSSTFNVNLPRSFKSVSQYNIIRRNIVRDNLDPNSSGISTEVYRYGTDPANIATGNHIYNNLITNIANYPIVFATDGSVGASAYNNYYKNNIVYNNSFTYQLWIMNSPVIYDNYFNNNVFYKSGITNILNIRGVYTSVSGIQASDPTHFWSNIQQDPMLDANYYPLTGSPCIDSGDFLTKVSSANGSGSTFTVADASYFSYGFGIASGDQITVGKATATIVSIDYVKNSITVATPISWNSGDPVSLPYNGTKPDVGPFEYGATTLTAPTTPQPIPLNLR